MEVLSVQCCHMRSFWLITQNLLGNGLVKILMSVVLWIYRRYRFSKIVVSTTYCLHWKSAWSMSSERTAVQDSETPASQGPPCRRGLEGRTVETPYYNIFEVGQEFFDRDKWALLGARELSVSPPARPA